MDSKTTFKECAEKQGKGGFWCQGNCVYIEANEPSDAAEKYIQQIVTRRGVAVNSHLPDGLKHKHAMERLTRANQVIYQCERAIEKVFENCDREDWPVIFAALESIKNYRNYEGND